MSTTITLLVSVPDEQAGAFLTGLTGNDSDIVLAAERAMRDRLGDSPTGDEVEIDMPGESAVREGLRVAAANSQYLGLGGEEL